MLNLWNGVLSWWANLPQPVKTWLKGAETAVVAALFAAFTAGNIADLHTRKGWCEFIGGTLAAGYGALRLYMMQSPISTVIKQVETSKTVSVGDVTQTDTTKETLTQQAAPAVESVVVDAKTAPPTITNEAPTGTLIVANVTPEPSKETIHEESNNQLAAFLRACIGRQ